MEEEYVYRQRKRMRRGYTTGSCAAAASCAAADMLLRGGMVPETELITPAGITLRLKVEQICRGPGWVSCAVRKDAGDDPDVTDGMLVSARAEYGETPRPDAYCRAVSDGFSEGAEAGRKAAARPEAEGAEGGDASGPLPGRAEGGLCLYLAGGEGVGLVTKPGLSCPVGKAAINPVPRSMIFDQVEAVCRRAGFSGAMTVTVSIPGGRETAKKTFNPYLGIEGGISVLGTTGIVEPMSEAALVETIRLSMRQRAALDERDLILFPGNYGAAFLKAELGLSPDGAVKCSNYVGESLDMAAELGFRRVLLVGHGGKLVKLAAGIMNTHSSWADGRGEIFAAYGAACGAGRETAEELLSAVTVDEAVSILEREGLREAVMGRILERVAFHLKKRAGAAVQAEALLFTNAKGVLGMTPGAEALLGELRQKRRSDGKDETE